MEQNISTLIEMVESVALRYKLASVLGLKKIIATLINDQCSYYLKDTNYGRMDPWGELCNKLDRPLCGNL